jgi:antitoxin component YwqK of YwqJK toxin-antitoxin module
LLWRKPISDESCIHCGQSADVDDRETGSGRVHERCWDAFNEEKPVAKLPIVAGIFGFSMFAIGGVVLSVGLIALSIASALDRTSQNILEAMTPLVLWFAALGVAFLAIPAGAIMLSIAFFTWVVTNNSALKNYVALGVVAIAAVALAVVWLPGEFRYAANQRAMAAGHEQVSDDGTVTRYFSSLRENKKAEGKLDRGQRVGAWTEWSRSGYREASLNYRAGRSHGLQNFWHNNGQKSQESFHVDGKMQGPSTGWHANRQMRVECNYVDGKKDGRCSSWYDNGHKHMECNYVGGKMDGKCMTGYYSGQKRSECNYVDGEFDGEMDGVQTNWHENGRKSVETEIINGAWVSSTYWDEFGEVASDPTIVEFDCSGQGLDIWTTAVGR